MGRRLRPGPIGGYFSQRARRQTAARQQRAAGVGVRTTTAGWSDNHCSGGCGTGGHRVPALLAPAHGSSPSDVAGEECTSLPFDEEKKEKDKESTTS